MIPSMEVAGRRTGVPLETLSGGVAITVVMLSLNVHWVTLMIKKALDTFGVTRGLAENASSIKDHDY